MEPHPSHAGNRTRAAWVKARNPNHSGPWTCRLVIRMFQLSYLPELKRSVYIATSCQLRNVSMKILVVTIFFLLYFSSK
ncbi:hypothetical protein CEXT_10741 [Caerostris extrusa]|uniref:Uncharacterized protein n=1 Tax=Caerostris extrusa TaxID=172846 RepID=A0AAV4VMP8_CAEEX|nr:hypothetical protein CEXT_10741 [Caerostris extrusa]